MSFMFLWILYLSTSLVISEKIKIPKKFQDTGSTSLLCNICGKITDIVNETLYQEKQEFESMIGFRLDSKGNKIRKDSQWLHLFLKLEESCDSIKDKYRVGKRENGYLYLISNEDIREIESKEANKMTKIEEEQKLRLQETIISELEQRKIEYLKNNTISDSSTLNDNETNITVSDIEYKTKYYYVKETKPKLLKIKSKTSKSVSEMCFFITEHFDDWLHQQQRLLKNDDLEEQEEKLSSKLDLGPFCVIGFENSVCELEMFNQTAQLFTKRKKKSIKLPIPDLKDWLKKNDDSQNNEEIENEEVLVDDLEEKDESQSKPEL